MLGLDAPLLLFQFLVTLGGARLTLEARQLFVDFFAQIIQAVEVFARVADARFGFAPALLVFGNAGGFFQIHPQVFRLGVDDARHHALLDNRVAARAEAGAEEDIRNVAATAAAVVEEIFGLPGARDQALDRDFIVFGEFALDRAVGIVEHQLDRGLPHRLARRRAAEDNVFHRFAAQMLGR